MSEGVNIDYASGRVMSVSAILAAEGRHRLVEACDEGVLAIKQCNDTITALRKRVAELEGVVHRVEADLGHTMVLHEDYDLPAQLVSAIDYSKTRLHAALAASKRAGGEGEHDGE